MLITAIQIHLFCWNNLLKNILLRHFDIADTSRDDAFTDHSNILA